MTTRDLNALLGSRICHDLISPLGAIGNGIELLTLSGINAAPEIALISESVENASVRIRFFRIAFGAASATEMIGAQECKALMADLSRGGRLNYRWLASSDMPRREVKLAYLLLLCLETALPYGGEVTVAHQDDRWSINGRADRMRIESDLWALLVDPSANTDVTAANVHFALVGPAASLAGSRVSCDLSEGEIKIGF